MPGKMIYVRMNKTKAGEGGHWKEAKRIEAITTYLSTGNLTETGRMTGVPLKTLEQWKKSDWWKEMEKRIRSDEDQQMDAKLTKIIDRTLEKLVDSIENGEHIYDQRTGQVKRMPAKMRDLNTILDKRQLIRRQPTKIVEQTTTSTQLQNLADQFANFVKKTVQELPTQEFIENDTVIQNEEGVWEVKE